MMSAFHSSQAGSPPCRNVESIISEHGANRATWQSRCGAGAHHIPLGTDVGPRAQDHQQPQLRRQVQEGFHVPIPGEVIHPRLRLVVVPGDVAGGRRRWQPETAQAAGCRSSAHSPGLTYTCTAFSPAM